MIYSKLFVYIVIYSILVLSCGGTSGGIVSVLTKDTTTKSALIIQNASKATMQSITLAKKSYTYKQEKLPTNLNCITLGFVGNSSRDVNLSLVSYTKYTKKSGDKNLICEMYDYKNFDKNISGELNKIFILNT